MNFKLISSAADIRQAAQLSWSNHQVLASTQAWLPVRQPEHVAPRLAWMADNGQILGAWDNEGLAAFWGAFTIDDFRNAGAGAFSPDWSHAVRADLPHPTAVKLYRELYRQQAQQWQLDGTQIHAAGVLASSASLQEALLMLGFGRIMLDAAIPTDELLRLLPEPAGDPACTIRQATPGDAAILEELNARLADHIGASPIFLPNPQGRSQAEWAEWLQAPDSVAYLAVQNGQACAYIMAMDPPFDVSWCVHASTTLAINGLFVQAPQRSRGIAVRLLSALARHGASSGKTLMSVDCETANAEASNFWTRWFIPCSWSYQRRI